jgi:ankyrin repeat protein
MEILMQARLLLVLFAFVTLMLPACSKPEEVATSEPTDSQDQIDPQSESAANSPITPISLEDYDNPWDDLEIPEPYAEGESPEPTMGLFEAIQANDVEQVRRHIAVGTSLNEAKRRGYPPLGQALEEIDRGVIFMMLLRAGATTDMSDSLYSFSTLHFAAGFDNAPAIIFLLNEGSELDQQLMGTITPLHMAASEGGCDAVRILVAAGADVNVVYASEFGADEEEFLGGTALHMAAYRGEHDSVRLLLDAGAKVDVKNDDGETPLELAARRFHGDSITYLLAAGADPSEMSVDELLLVASMGDVARIKELLAAGADIEAAESGVFSPLICAAMNGKSEAVRTLLEAGAQFDKDPPSFASPLCVAAERGHVETMRVLIDAGANVNFRDRYNDPPIYSAARSGQTEAILLLIEEGASVNAGINSETTNLHTVLGSKNVEAARTLLDNGANVDSLLTSYGTPLRWAVVGGNYPMAEILLEYGADPDLSIRDLSTPLQEAVQTKRIRLIELLLTNGADPNLESRDDRTPLQNAVYYQCGLKVTEALLEGGADPTKNQFEAVHAAIRANDTEMLNLYLDHGVDLGALEGDDIHSFMASTGGDEVLLLMKERGFQWNDHPTNEENVTLLHLASRNGNVYACELFLRQGADVNAGDEQGTTPLHIAAQIRNSEMCTLFLNHNANINAIDEEGAPPLHVALRTGNTETCLLLLSQGADVNMRGKQGATPFHLVHRCSIEIVQALLDAGAEVNARDGTGLTPLDSLSRGRDFEEMKAFLIDHGAKSSRELEPE